MGRINKPREYDSVVTYMHARLRAFLLNPRTRSPRPPRRTFFSTPRLGVCWRERSLSIGGDAGERRFRGPEERGPRQGEIGSLDAKEERRCEGANRQGRRLRLKRCSGNKLLSL